MKFTIECADGVTMETVVKTVLARQAEKELESRGVRDIMKEIIAEHRDEIMDKAVKTAVKSIIARLAKEKAYREAMAEYLDEGD